MILPLSGNNAYLGENARDGALLRLGQIDNNRRLNYELILEDNEADSKQTALITQRLKNQDVDIIISYLGQFRSVILPQLLKTQIIHIGLENWGEYIEYPYDFGIGSTHQRYVDKMLEACQAIGITRIAFVTNFLKGTMPYAHYIENRAADYGIELVDNTQFSRETKDFRTYLLKLQQKNPQLLINGLIMPQTEIIEKQIDQMQMSFKTAGFYGYYSAVSPTFIEGSFYTFNLPPQNDFSEAFVEKFNRKPGVPSQNAYDAISIIIEAYENKAPQKATPDQIVANFRQIKDFNGALGPTSFKPPYSIESPIGYYIVHNGQHHFVSLDELVDFVQTSK